VIETKKTQNANRRSKKEGLWVGCGTVGWYAEYPCLRQRTTDDDAIISGPVQAKSRQYRQTNYLRGRNLMVVIYYIHKVHDLLQKRPESDFTSTKMRSIPHVCTHSSYLGANTFGCSRTAISSFKYRIWASMNRAGRKSNDGQ